MRVMQFGFGNPGAHIYLPHRFEQNTVVYTGTHDNDTTCGWWRSQATEEERRYAGVYLGADEQNVNWAFLRSAFGSVAKLAIVPVQDVLGLGSEARMNTPSRTEGNWGWRLQPGVLTQQLAQRLADLTELCDRDPRPLTIGQQGYREVREHFAA